MIVRHKKNKIYYIGLMVFMVLFLQGCSSEIYVNEQTETIIEEGRPILEKYVNSLSEKAYITDISIINGCRQGEPSFAAKFPSHIVQATFLAGDKHYTAVANIEDGKIYSNYDYIDPNELIQRQLTKYCDEYGFKGTYKVSGAFYSYAFISHQIEVNANDVRDIYVYIDNIPDLAQVDENDEFMNASISGFDIEYESEYDEVFEPEILYKYLTETGNYRKEDMRGDNREYHISGGLHESNYIDGEPVYYNMNIKSDGNPDTMVCEVLRYDYKEENSFCYLYIGGIKKENIRNIAVEEYIEYNCPFAFRDNELIYIRDDYNPYEGYLYIKNPEWNEIVMTRYKLTNKSLDDKSNDIVDRWELEFLEQDELEIAQSELADLFELYIKGTNNKCEFTDDKDIVVFR